jgi:hypothetical protein
MNICYILGIILLCNFCINLLGYKNNEIKSLNKALKSFMIKSGYNLIYILSVSQIQLNKLKNKFNPKFIYIKNLIYNFLKENKWIEEIPSKIILLIDNDCNILKNVVLTTCSNVKKTIEKNHNDLNLIKNLEFLDKNVETGFINHIFYESIPDTLDYELSKINLLMVNLEHNDKTYNIALKDDSNNYYIINNFLNQNFFKYYIKNVLKTELNCVNFDYKVTIIDHNADLLTLSPNQTLVFEEKGYQIISSESFDKPITTEEDIINDDTNFNNDSDKSDDFVKLELE